MLIIETASTNILIRHQKKIYQSGHVCSSIRTSKTCNDDTDVNYDRIPRDHENYTGYCLTFTPSVVLSGMQTVFKKLYFCLYIAISPVFDYTYLRN